ncbi:Pentraxin-related [Trinorchestia longiramus]|nr:Pentraxin-related [Trinorchestia longiramus]
MIVKASLLMLALFCLAHGQYNRLNRPVRPTSGILFPNRPSQGTCSGVAYQKMTTAQTMYVQYEEFAIEMAQLQEFSTCFWMNVEDSLRTATLLNYAIDEPVNNDNITLQYFGKELRWVLKINGQNAYISKAVQLTPDTWVHLCHSWNGKTGEWSVWQNGYLIDSGVSQHTRGWIIPAGGVLVAGQHQNTITNGGMDRGEGLVGSLTLMHVSNKHLSPADPYARRYVQQVSQDCSAKARGEIVDWVFTPRRGYGGVTSSPAKPICGAF